MARIEVHEQEKKAIVIERLRAAAYEATLNCCLLLPQFNSAQYADQMLYCSNAPTNGQTVRVSTQVNKMK